MAACAASCFRSSRRSRRRSSRSPRRAIRRRASAAFPARTRASRWGRDTIYLSTYADDICVIIQIETPQAIGEHCGLWRDRRCRRHADRRQRPRGQHGPSRRHAASGRRRARSKDAGRAIRATGKASGFQFFDERAEQLIEAGLHAGGCCRRHPHGVDRNGRAARTSCASPAASGLPACARCGSSSSVTSEHLAIACSLLTASLARSVRSRRAFRPVRRRDPTGASAADAVLLVEAVDDHGARGRAGRACPLGNAEQGLAHLRRCWRCRGSRRWSRSMRVWLAAVIGDRAVPQPRLLLAKTKVPSSSRSRVPNRPISTTSPSTPSPLTYSPTATAGSRPA